MKAAKKNKLEAAGWRVGSASDFLELCDAEQMLVNMKLELAANLKTMRQKKKITQEELAKRIKSSQSRVAKMEAADSSVSIGLLLLALATLGATPAQIGKIVSCREAAKRKQPGKKNLVKQKRAIVAK